MDFAERVAKEAGAETGGQVRLAWRLALGREPSATELKSGMKFLNARVGRRSTGAPAETATRQLALVDLCQAIFALNEFIYVD